MGSAGKTQIIVNAASIPDGDSIASYLVDSLGQLLTSTLVGGLQSLDVNVAQSVLPTGAATEATLATRASEATVATLATEATVATLATEVTVGSILSELQSITFNEDDAHTTGDAGVMALAVRNDSGSVLAGTTGDYIPLTTDSTGALRTIISGTILANIEGDYAEDSAHVDGDRGLFMLSVRNDNQSTTFAGTTGDYAPIATDKKGAIYTKDISNGANLQQIVTVGNLLAVALPTAPLADRNSMFIQMLSGGKLYLGSATVTSSGATRGLLLGQGGFVNLSAGPSAAIYGIADGAGKEVAVWEFA